MENCVICKGATKNDHETVQLILQRGSNGVNKPVNCEVIRSLPLQDSTFIRSADTNILQQKTISASTSGPPEQPSTTRLCAPEKVFYFTEHCIFCSKPTCLSGNKRSVDVFPVRTS